MCDLCTSQDKTKEHAKEENEETTNQTRVQGIHRHLFYQTGRRTQTYMLGYLIPRNYMEAMPFDKANKTENVILPLN